MDCPKRDRMAAVLPDDPLLEILSRVPVKSLCRFKCVSKAWRDLIADPCHRRKLPQTLEGLFCIFMGLHQEIRGGDGVGGVRIHRYADGGGFIDLMGRPAPLVDSSFSFLTQRPGIDQIRILHYCNGLLLLRHSPFPLSCGWDKLGYVVCNPATKEWVAVPSSSWYSDLPEAEDEEDDDMELSEETFLFFDPAVSSHFKLLQFLQQASMQSEVGLRLRTYSSETGVWTDRSGEPKRLGEGGQTQLLGSFGSIASTLGSAFVNGMLHFIVYHTQKDQELIVAVDWEGNTRKVINCPRVHGCIWSEPAHFGQSQGRLCCVSDHIELNSMKMTIWALEDYDKEEWVMKHSVTYWQLFGRRVKFDYRVVAIHPDRNLVFVVERDQRLMSHNIDSKEVHAVCTLGIGYEGIIPYVPYFSESSVLSNKH